MDIYLLLEISQSARMRQYGHISSVATRPTIDLFSLDTIAVTVCLA